MKVSGAIIQPRNIKKWTSHHFEASYKGKYIYISTDHGFGKPEYSHLFRFNIEVTDIKTGGFDVDTYGDYHEIRDAIRYALEGACLINNNPH